MVRTVANKLGFDIVRTSSPVATFHSPHYLRHNARRLEHLASLRVDVAGRSVLEVGAGIGDHSHYYLDRGCSLTITEARSDNLRALRRRYPANSVQFLDLDRPTAVDGAPFDVVHCYGLLYHLGNPNQALEFLSRNTTALLFLETCVSFGDEDELYPVDEDISNPSQAYSGVGRRPTRPWLFKRLQALFEHVYVPTTQPNHEEFPLHWNGASVDQTGLTRAVFIASRNRVENEALVGSLISTQKRHH